MNRPMAAGVAVIALVGAVSIGVGAAELAERLPHWRAGAHTEGEVVSAERQPLRELISPFSRSVYEVEYRFATPAGTMRSRGIYRTEKTAQPQSGHKLRVSYLREDPASSIVEDSFTAFDAGILIGAGLLMWVGGALFLWPELRRRRSRSR